MNAREVPLTVLLRLVATVQGVVAAMYLFLPRVSDVALGISRLPSEARLLFGRHCDLIALILTGCAALTWRFARDFARGAGAIGRWLAATIGVFWTFRSLQQLDALLDCEPWMLSAHLAACAFSAGLALVYFLTASWKTATGGDTPCEYEPEPDATR
jgi:hypothetical protein